MSSPTEAEVQAQWRNAVALLKSANAAAADWLLKEDTFTQSLESDFDKAMLNAVASARAGINATLATAKTIQFPHIQSYIHHIVKSSNALDERQMISDLYDWFIKNGIRITSRQFTFGTPTAGTNTGNGSIFRLNKDEQNFDIENQFAEAKSAKCIIDQNTGADKWEEIFEFRGEVPAVDELGFKGSGLSTRIKAYSARDSLLDNASFSRIGGGDPLNPTSIPSWTATPDTMANFEFDSTDYFRDFPGDVVPYALKVKATETITQKLSVRGTKLDAAFPYFLSLAFNRSVGAAVGTLVAKMGTKSVSVDLGTAAAGWNVVTVPATFGQDNWYNSFKQQDTAIEIEITLTSGFVLIDDVIFAPFQEFGGGWYVILPNSGTPVPFSVKDSFTWTDSEVGSQIQYWLFRSFRRYLPHATGINVTFADP